MNDLQKNYMVATKELNAAAAAAFALTEKMAKESGISYDNIFITDELTLQEIERIEKFCDEKYGVSKKRIAYINATNKYRQGNFAH